MQVSIVNHTMTIIETDFVPVDSFTTDSLFIGIGQRYDVTIDASQATDNYWFNITYGGSGFCGSSNNPHPAAIIHYDGASTDNPADPGSIPTDHECLDYLSYTPVVSRTVPTNTFVASASNSLGVALTANNGNKWTVNGSTLQVDWNHPVAQYVAENETSWPSSDNVWRADEEDEVRGYISPPPPTHK